MVKPLLDNKNIDVNILAVYQQNITSFCFCIKNDEKFCWCEDVKNIKNDEKFVDVNRDRIIIKKNSFTIFLCRKISKDYSTFIELIRSGK